MHCPHCETNLDSLPPDTTTCPECQRELVRVGASGSPLRDDLSDEQFWGDAETLKNPGESDVSTQIPLGKRDQRSQESPDDADAATTIAGADADTVQTPAQQTAGDPADTATFIQPSSHAKSHSGGTLPPSQTRQQDATDTKAADPNATFVPPSDPNATFLAGAADDEEPAMMQTGIGNFADGWSEAMSQPGVTDDSSLKVHLTQQADSQSTLVIQSRSMSSPDAASPTADAVDYDLIDTLGKGGMGVVYAARQASIDRTVAVKMLKGGTKGSVDERNKFLSEACVTGDLEHPNIVPIYDVGHDASGALFYAMKRVQGTPWKDVLGEKSLDENVQILMRVADAVAFAHSKGILHRDLKPENTMLGGFGEVLVMDWGLAMPIDLNRRFGGIRQLPDLGGTPAYMAPEMIIGPLTEIGIHSDIYLLGAILFEIATGKRPHASTPEMNCIHAAAHNVIQQTSRKSELTDIALKAMKTHPKLRYASVVEFQEAVKEYQSHSESIHLSDLAARHCDQANRSQSYEDFNQALFGFQQALELWDGNESAKTQLAETRFVYATTAKARGDYDLASSLLDLSVPQHSTLHREITEAAHQRDVRQQRAKTYRRLGLALASLLFVVVTGAAVWINSARNEAEIQKQKAIVQKGVAEDNWQLAEERKDAVIEEKAEVERQKAEVEQQRMIAVENANEAKRQEGIAKNKEAEAVKQKGIAEDNMLLAQTKEREANQQRMKAEAEERRAVAARRAEAYEAYVARIGAAAARIEENAHDQARELLQQCKPQNEGDDDHRNWEWQRLWYLCQQAISTVDVAAPVESLAASWKADGTLAIFAAGTLDGSVEIRQADGSVVSHIKPSGRCVHAVAFSPDASLLLTASDVRSDSLQLFDVATGELIRTFSTSDAATSSAFSADGRLILSAATDGTATVWNADSGESLLTLHGHRGPVRQAIFVPGNNPTRLVTAGEDGAAIVWTDGSGRWNNEDEVRQSASFTEHSGAVHAVAIAPDGNTIATAGHDQRVLLWQVSALRNFDFTAALNTVSATSATPHLSFDGHKAAVRSLAFSEDGKTLVSAGHDNTICVWDRGAGFQPPSSSEPKTRWKPLPRKTLRGHGQWITSCCLSPNGQTIVSASYDETVRVWDVQNYQEVGELQATTLDGHDDAVLDAQFSPSSDRIVTASRDRTVRTWDTKTRSPLMKLREGHAFLASRGVFTNDGKKLATAAVDGTVRIWNANTGSQEHILTNTGRGTVAAFSSDGKLLATGGPSEKPNGEDRPVWNARIWDAATGVLLHELSGHAGQISALTFAPNSDTVYCGDTTGLGLLWNAATGKRLRRLAWHKARIIAARFLDDGTLVTAAAERAVARWNVADGTVDESNLLLHRELLKAVDIDASGRFVATVCNDNSVRFWDWSTGRIIHQLRDATDASTNDRTNISSVALSPNSQQVAITDAAQRIVRLYDVPSGDEIFYRLTNDRKGPFLQLPQHHQLSTVLFSRDGQDVLTVGGDRVMLWDNDARQLPFRRMKANFSPHGVVATAAYSPDQELVLSGSWDGTAVIWNAESGTSVRKLTGAHRGPINSAVFCPQAKSSLALTTSDDGTAVLWNASAGTFVRRFSGQAGRILDGSFSPDGKSLVTTSTDGTARIWNTTDNTQPLYELKGHAAAVKRATFSDDGLLLATASADNSAMLWDLQNGKVIRKFSGHTATVNDVVFTFDGKRIITASDDFHCKVWDTSTGKELLTLTGHTREVGSLALSHNKETLLTGSHDGTAILWPTARRKESLER